MTHLARATVAADAFELGRLFRTNAAAAVELLPLVPLGERMPYVRVETDDVEAFEADLRRDSRVATLTRHGSHARGTLYHVEWAAEIGGLPALLRTHGVSIDRGVGVGDEWTFRLRAPDGSAMRTFRAACRERDMPLDIENVSALTRDPDGVQRHGPFREVIDNLDVVVWMSDAEKTEILYVNPAYEAVWGEPRERLYRDPLAFLDAVHPDDRERVRAAIESQPHGEYDEEYRIERPDGTQRWIRDRSVPIRNAEGDVSRVAGIADDITDRKERERIFVTLNEVTRAFLEAGGREDIADIAVRTASEVLELPLVSVYFYDDGALRPIAHSPDVAEIIGELPTFTGSESLAWDAFVAGETRMYDDVRTQEGAYNPDTPIRSELIVPIGDHGVFLMGDRVSGAFDDGDVEFAELLAANATAALDRVEYQEDLERRNERLVELSRLNDTIRGINRAIVNATTRDEIVAAVCEQLVSGPYLAAWVGGHPTGEQIAVRATAGAAADAFESDRITAADAGPLDELVTTATRTRAVYVIRDLREASSLDVRHERLVERGCRGVAAVPLTAGEALYGVLVLYTDRLDVFGKEELAILREFGGTIGRAIRAANIRRALTSERAVELDLGIADSDWLFVAIADELDCRLHLEGIVALGDETLRYYVGVTGASPGRVVDLATQRNGVDDGRVISETEDDGLVAFRRTGTSPSRILLDYGATVRSAAAESDGGRLTVEVTPETDLRTLLAGVRNEYSGVELAGKHTLDRSVGTVQQFRQTLGDELTDKQLRALRTAHFAGYFEWPRRSTAEEIAASLDISSATFHFHLRHALRKLFAAFFEREYGRPGRDAG
jgi:PAS domain S-box-containing protein